MISCLYSSKVEIEFCSQEMDVEDGKAGRKKIRKSLFATGATQLSNSSVRIVGKSISTSVLTVVPRPR